MSTQSPSHKPSSGLRLARMAFRTSARHNVDFGGVPEVAPGAIGIIEICLAASLANGNAIIQKVFTHVVLDYDKFAHRWRVYT